MGRKEKKLQKKDQEQQSGLAGLTERCLGAFVVAGTLDLSLDVLGVQVSVSKRMLIHYFGSRENLEFKVLEVLEDRLRARFRADAFPAGTSAKDVVEALWEQSVAKESRGTLQVIMDVSRRGWSGSARARDFYEEQQRLWVKLLRAFFPDKEEVEELLQLFQGAVLLYLVTGDREKGWRALSRLVKRLTPMETKKTKKERI